MQEFQGIPVSAGIAIGRVFRLDDAHMWVPRRTVAPDRVDHEKERLATAIAASLADLDTLREKAEVGLGKEAAAIFAFHQGMLRDRTLVSPMNKQIDEEHVSAEYALQEQCNVVASMFAGMGDPAFSTKVDDVWDLNRRVMSHLVGAQRSALDDLDYEAIVVAPDLTPSQAASFPPGRVLGFATDKGGPTSHTAIFARALGIPASVGTATLCEVAEECDEIIVDGDKGVVILRPDAETLEHYRLRKAHLDAIRAALSANQPLEARTTDGIAVHLMGNVEMGIEAEQVLEQGGEGIGLFRTEFLWLTRNQEPTEDEQFEEFKSAVLACKGLPVTLRTYDLGADKYTQSRSHVPERNPFLGLRSIRYCLASPVMFKRHLRAIMRASAFGPIRIMFPLVTATEELRRAKMHLKDVMEDLSEEGIDYDPNVKVGMMVEVPAAAVMAASFAREVDFFSIGTNDLVQYTLAVDRTNEKVSAMYSAAHPAILKLIKDVVRVGRHRKVDVSVCGEAAGDIMFTMLLIGVGLRTLSVSPRRIPYLKKVIRSVDIATCERLARTVGSLDSEASVTAFLRDQAMKRFPEFVDGRAADVERTSSAPVAE
jgi:phosphotransferase system enzyme I (PtsI)